MKHLHWMCAGSVAVSVLLLGGWGVFGVPRAQPVALPEVTAAVPADTGAEGGGTVYHAVAAPDDIARYRAVAAFTRKRQWAEADSVIAKLKNRDLVGYYLATRYTDKTYAPSAAELQRWLRENGASPQAQGVLRRMRILYPKEAAAVFSPPRRRSLQGYGDASHAALSLPKAEDAFWRGGLAAWKRKDFPAAARDFSAMAASDRIAAHHRAAAAFWSYRAYEALGDTGKARYYLEEAAKEDPRSFYGLAASARLGNPVWRPEPEEITRTEEWQGFVTASPVAQVVLLHAIGEEEAAERLLRRVYFDFDPSGRQRLTALAHTIGIASAVLPMARHAGADSEALQAARYPLPQWHKHLRHSSDPALVLAIVKQESGFNPRAGSPKGAQGLMQILPSTAAYMRRQKDTLEIKTAALDNTGLEALPRSWSLRDPAYNLTIGQAYLRYLSSKPYIDHNLVYLLAAYNAGAAPLLRWKESIGDNDPLLFIESIPFAETRHYVKNVLGNYWIYEGMLENENAPQSLQRLLRGYWPRMSRS